MNYYAICGGVFLRVRLDFHIDNFPLAYRLGVLSYIKQVIRSQSESFYQSFFIDNETQTKTYTFAAYFQNFKIEGDKIEADAMSVTVSSSNIEFMIYLINGCQQNKNFVYKDTTMSLRRLELLKEKTINTSQVWFRTLSPLLVESKHGKPVLASDPTFENELNIIASKMMQTNIGRDLYQPLKILNSHLKKMVIKENFHQVQDDYLYFTANKGEFLIKGDPRDLNFFYQNGLALRRGSGFGCLDIM